MSYSKRTPRDGSIEDHLLQVLMEAGSLEGFLDAVFQFLGRRTDFYQRHDYNTAENLMKKLWEANGNERSHIIDSEVKYKPKPLSKITGQMETVARRRLENTQDTNSDKSSEKSNKSATSSLTSNKLGFNELVSRSNGNNHNGATCRNYSWTQTLSEVDVMVELPVTVTSANHVTVFIRSTDLTVVINVGGNWVPKIDGRLFQPINVSNSMWTLHPGSHVHISLEKEKERWWEMLILNEEQVEKGKIERSVKLEDLTDDAQAIVRKLAYEQYLKQKVRSSYCP